MTARRRSKMSRHRGNRSHGWGHKKKHRGGGSRGGKGRAGLHKHKYVYAIVNKLMDRGRFSKTGFIPKPVAPDAKTINLYQLEQSIQQLLEKKLATKSGKTVTIDCSKIGIDKILGGGRVSTPLNITVSSISESAKNKIEKAGGKVNAGESSERAA